jgi:hypothetical protein
MGSSLREHLLLRWCSIPNPAKTAMFTVEYFVLVITVDVDEFPGEKVMVDLLVLKRSRLLEIPPDRKSLNFLLIKKKFALIGISR